MFEGDTEKSNAFLDVTVTRKIIDLVHQFKKNF